MKVGDLVRHAIHTGALGIIVEESFLNPHEVKVHWTNNGWGEKWDLRQNIEVIDANR